MRPLSLVVALALGNVAAAASAESTLLPAALAPSIFVSLVAVCVLGAVAIGYWAYVRRKARARARAAESMRVDEQSKNEELRNAGEAHAQATIRGAKVLQRKADESRKAPERSQIEQLIFEEVRSTDELGAMEVSSPLEKRALAPREGMSGPAAVNEETASSLERRTDTMAFRSDAPSTRRDAAMLGSITRENLRATPINP